MPDATAIAALIERAHKEVDEGLLPSCQLAVAFEGELLAFEAIGDATTDSRYVVFSCTKGFTAGAVWMLLAEGSLRLDQRVVEVVPEFGTNGKEVITVEMLLTHTGGFPTAPLRIADGATSAGRVAAFERWRLNWEPGTRFEYHPTSGHWVLGEMIERVTGIDTPTFIRQRIVEPLGLPAFTLGQPVDSTDPVQELVPTGEEPTSEELEAVLGVPGLTMAMLAGEVTTAALLEFNDPATRAAGAPGGGGIATAADLALYYQGMHHDPKGLWDPAIKADAIAVHCTLPHPLFGIPANWSLGLQVAGSPPEAQRRGFGHNCSPATYGHDGAGGQVAWVDPASGLSFGYVTNGLDRNPIREARRKIGLSSRAAAIAKK